MAIHYVHRSDFGAELVREGQSRFRLWAPTAQDVALKLPGREPLPMQPMQNGWFELIANAPAGTAYHFQIRPADNDEVVRIPDPASRAQAGDVHDDSLVVDPAAYAWRNAAWKGRPWHEAVIYELHVGTCGGFSGVTQKLVALAELGVTAVELMPIADFPGQRNWGYDGVLPFAPDAAYGTPEDLKNLIDTAHGLNMMVFLDVVYNHFGPDGNYLRSYAAPFFRGDICTPWGDAVDFRHPTVRSFFIENALFWLCEYRFDGLRFDAVHEIYDPDFLVQLARTVKAAIGKDRHVHLVLENDNNAASLLEDAFDAQWNDDGHHVLHYLLTGEDFGYYRDYSENAAEKLARCLAEGFIYQGEKSIHREGRSRGEPSAGLPPTAFVLFLQNHDQLGNRAFGERLSTLAPQPALEAAQALLLLSPQIPLLFMGEEFGTRQPFYYFTDHRSPELAQAVRCGRRKEFARFPGFGDESAQARIPDPGEEETFLQSIVPVTEKDHGDAWLARTRELLALRYAHITPWLAGARSLGAKALGPAAVGARWRLADGVVLAIAVNFGADEVKTNLEDIAHFTGADLIYATPGMMTELARNCLPAYGFIAVLEAHGRARDANLEALNVPGGTEREKK